MTAEQIGIGITLKGDGNTGNASDLLNLRNNLRPIEFQVLCGGIAETPPVYRTGLFDVGAKISEED